MRITHVFMISVLAFVFSGSAQSKFLSDEQKQQIKDARASGERPKLSEILTPEQVAKMEEKKKQRIEKRAADLGVAVEELKAKREERLAKKAEELGVSVDEVRERQKKRGIKRRMARRQARRQDRRASAREAQVNRVRSEVRDEIRRLAEQQGVDLRDPAARRQFLRDNKDNLPRRDRRRRRLQQKSAQPSDS